MKKILLTTFVILCSVMTVFAQDDYKIKEDAYFNQRVIELTKAGTLEAQVMDVFEDVDVQGIKVIGPMNDKDLRFLAKLAKVVRYATFILPIFTKQSSRVFLKVASKILRIFMYIYFPETLKTINDNAFKNCNLRTVVLNNGLETIGKYAFYGTHSKSLSIPASVKNIGDAAFGGNKELHRRKS